MQTYNHLIDKSKIDSINSILVELTNLNNLLDGTELNNLKFFNRVYVFVAKELELSVSANKFIYPELIKKLDTAFALYYFDALNYFVENKKLPKLWNDVIEEKLFTPFYFLLGANVHINHDLSLAIVSSVANLPEFKNDFDATDKVISKAIKNFFKRA